MGHGEQVVEDMVDDHDGCAVFLLPHDLPCQQCAFGGVQAAERLVQDEQAGFLGERPGEVEALVQAERQLGRVAVGDVRETEAVQELGGPCPGRAR